MARAIELAIANVRSGLGGPFAAVIVKDGRVVAEGDKSRHLRRTIPTAHAEVLAIRAACQALASFQLHGCEIYTTCEPCPMCLGAIYWARLDRVYFGGTAADAAAAGFDDAFLYQQIAVDPQQRKIPFVPLMRDQALACFRAWRDQPDRINY